MKEKSHESHNTKEQNTNNEKYIHKKNEQKQINKKRQSVLFSSFFCVLRGTFFFFLKQNVTEKKVHEPRRWHTELAVYFRGVV